MAQAIILSSNTGILEIPGMDLILEILAMDLILEILAMDQTTITTKIMVNINMSSFTYHMCNSVNLLHFRQNSNLWEIIRVCYWYFVRSCPTFITSSKYLQNTMENGDYRGSSHFKSNHCLTELCYRCSQSMGLLK